MRTGEVIRLSIIGALYIALLVGCGNVVSGEGCKNVEQFLFGSNEVTVINCTSNEIPNMQVMFDMVTSDRSQPDCPMNVVTKQGNIPICIQQRENANITFAVTDSPNDVAPLQKLVQGVWEKDDNTKKFVPTIGQSILGRIAGAIEYGAMTLVGATQYMDGNPVLSIVDRRFLIQHEIVKPMQVEAFNATHVTTRNTTFNLLPLNQALSVYAVDVIANHTMQGDAVMDDFNSVFGTPDYWFEVASGQ